MIFRSLPPSRSPPSPARAVALGTPTLAKATFDADNAHRVDGYHAAQLNVVKHWNATKPLDDPDGCRWQPVLTGPLPRPPTAPCP